MSLYSRSSPNPYRLAIEEMVIDGTGISLGRCSRSTVYRWAKECNEILERDKTEWRVKPNYKDCGLDIIPANQLKTRVKKKG